MGDLSQHLVELCHVVIGGVAIYHNVVDYAVLLKSRFLEPAKHRRTVRQFVVVVRGPNHLADLARRGCPQNMQIAQGPV